MMKIADDIVKDTVRTFQELPQTTDISEHVNPLLSEKAKQLLELRATNTEAKRFGKEGEEDVLLTARYISHAVEGDVTEDNYKRLAYAVNKAAELDLFEMQGPCPPCRLKFFPGNRSLLFVVVMTQCPLEDLRTYNSQLFPTL